MKLRPVLITVLLLAAVVATLLVRVSSSKPSRTRVEHRPSETAPVSTGTAVRPVVATGFHGPPGRAPVKASRTEAPADLSSPLAAVQASEEETRVLHEAEQAEIAACMQERGFEYATEPYSNTEELTTPHFEGGDVVTASRTGYGLAEAADQPSLKDANQDRLQRMSRDQRDAWEIALYGAPQSPPEPSPREEARDPRSEQATSGDEPKLERDACIFRAQREMYGKSYGELDARVHAVLDQVHERVAQDRRFPESMTRWRQCMQERGFSYATPGAGADALERELRENRLSLEDLRVKEVDVALADATCFNDAGLSEIRRDVEHSISSENSRLFDAFREARASVVERSRRLARR